MDILGHLRSIVGQKEDRAAKAKRIAEIIRASGPYRWVGIYDVDLLSG